MSILPFSFELAIALFESEEQFPVDFDNAYLWLGYTRKDNAKRALINFGFIENVDYKLLIIEECLPQGGSTRFEKITLTVECFKTWGMMAQTLQGKQVRKYFLDCERIAKEKTSSKTEIELLHEATGRLVQIERENKIRDARIKAVETENKLQSAKLESHNDRIIGLEAEVERHACGSTQYYSIVAYAVILNVKVSLADAIRLGKQATAKCRASGVIPQQVRDPRFGLVNTYPENILNQLIWHTKAHQN